MKKISLLFLMLFLPAFLFSQILAPGYELTGKITLGMLGFGMENEGAFGLRAIGSLDINKNGKKEILILTEENNTTFVNSNAALTIRKAVYWFEENGNGGYELLWSYSNFLPAGYHPNFTVADLDKDGNEEIWVCVPTIANADNPLPPRIFCFEYDPVSGKMPNEPTTEWVIENVENFVFNASGIVVEDIDGCGEAEIIITSRNDGYTAKDGGATIAPGSNTGRTLLIAEHFLDIDPSFSGLGFGAIWKETGSSGNGGNLAGGALYEPIITDFDGDGKNEIWTVTWDKLTVNIHTVTGPHQYSFVKRFQHIGHTRAPWIDNGGDGNDLGTFTKALHFTEINGEKVGFLVGSLYYISDPCIPDVWLIEGTNNINNLTMDNFKLFYIGEEGRDFTGSCVADFNGNGIPELIITDRINDRIMSLEYKGTGSPSDPSNYTFDEIADLSMIEEAYLCFPYPHITSDGKLVLIVTNGQRQTELDGPILYVISPTATPVSVDKKTELPEAYSLSQNYPNPFNPSTNIEFSVPKAAHVSLKIYNMLGQEVSTLVNEIKEAGSYKTKFNANNLPSGVYWYKIEAGNYTATKKMMLIK